MDKLQIIEEEIEKRIASINSFPFRTAELGSEKFDEGMLRAYESILSFIRSLPENTSYCSGCNNDKGCITCVNGDQWAHIEKK